MAYTKQTWANGPGGGTPISAARLQHIEDGIGAASADATSSQAGLMRFATNAEALAGTSTVRAVTPAGWLAAFQGRRVSDLALPNAPFTMNGQRIASLGTPAASTDAATKGYVDGNVTAVPELGYAERVSNTPVASGPAGTLLDIPGVSVSFVMPSRPVMLQMGAVVQYIGTTQDAALSIVETTGTATVIGEFHGGQQANANDYLTLEGQRRITGSAGTTRTFKLVANVRTISWNVLAAATFPSWLGAYVC